MLLTPGYRSLIGSSMAEVLARSWGTPPAFENFSVDVISHIATTLLNSGTAALVWWRFQSALPQYADVLSPFQQAYTYYTIRAAVHEARARSVFAFMRAHGIEPVLIKGW